MGFQALPTYVLIGAMLLAGAVVGLLTQTPLGPGTGEAVNGVDADSTDASAYKATVIATLKGQNADPPSPRLEAGLVPGLSRLFGAMYCPENACTMASEMDYLYQTTQDMLYMMRNDILNRVCKTDALTPPNDQLAADRQRICSQLNNVFAELQALEQNVRTARDLLARNEDPSQFQSLLNELNGRMMQNRKTIVAELRALRSTAWLAPAFDGAEERIPRLAQPDAE